MVEEIDPADAFRHILERLEALERMVAEMRTRLDACSSSPRK